MKHILSLILLSLALLSAFPVEAQVVYPNRGAVSAPLLRLNTDKSPSANCIRYLYAYGYLALGIVSGGTGLVTSTDPLMAASSMPQEPQPQPCHSFQSRPHSLFWGIHHRPSRYHSGKNIRDDHRHRLRQHDRRALAYVRLFHTKNSIHHRLADRVRMGQPRHTKLFRQRYRHHREPYRERQPFLYRRSRTFCTFCFSTDWLQHYDRHCFTWYG